jgi:meso-butanediol dehydrogenase/(S,S)-butanediol dehydrogenase/diacetyl reductase
MDVRVDGRCAIVTGGAQGIGKGIALALAQSGAYVIIADIAQDEAVKTVEEIRAAGGKADSLYLDVTKCDQVEEVMDEVVRMGGKLDICVHSVGVHVALSFLNIAQKDVERLTHINILGTSNVMRAALKRMIPNHYGKLVVLTSIAARMGCADAHYGMTKAAQMHMAWSAAKEVAPYNINVNSIAPGFVYTSMWDTIIDTRVGDENKNRAEVREKCWNEAIQETMFKRPQKPEDIAYMAVFLCSDMAREITGQCINVCGGSRMN